MFVSDRTFKSRIKDSASLAQRAFGTFLHHISLFFKFARTGAVELISIINIANPSFSHKGDNPFYGNLTYLHELYLELRRVVHSNAQHQASLEDSWTKSAPIVD